MLWSGDDFFNQELGSIPRTLQAVQFLVKLYTPQRSEQTGRRQPCGKCGKSTEAHLELILTSLWASVSFSAKGAGDPLWAHCLSRVECFQKAMILKPLVQGFIRKG